MSESKPEGGEPSGEPRELDWDEVLPPLEEVPAGADAAPPELPEAPVPRWQLPEVAWPLAIFAGFLGSAIGITTGVPFAGAALATLLFAPLYLALVVRERTMLAALVSVGWLAALAGGAAGSVMESDFTGVALACPGAREFRDTQILPWLEGGSVDPSASGPLLHLAGGLVVLLLGRFSFGVLALGALAVVASSLGASLGWFAEQATSMEPIWACLLGIPLHHALALIGLLALTTCLADRRRLLPVGELEPARRRLLLGGAALFALGLVLEPFAVSAWGTWLAEAVG